MGTEGTRQAADRVGASAAEIPRVRGLDMTSYRVRLRRAPAEDFQEVTVEADNADAARLKAWNNGGRNEVPPAWARVTVFNQQEGDQAHGKE